MNKIWLRLSLPLCVALCSGSLFIEFLISNKVLAECNEFGCAPGYLRCNEFGCPTVPSIQIMPSNSGRERFEHNSIKDLLELIKLQQMIELNTPRLPPGCYKTQDTNLFCFLNVYRTSNPNLKRVDFKINGKTWTNYFIDCSGRVIGDGRGYRRPFNKTSIYYKACSDYR